MEKKAVLVDYAAEMLRKKILGGELKPGQKVGEREMIAELKVSRTPLREAFRVLQAEGLLKHIPQRGVIVAEGLDEQEIIDMMYVQSILLQEASRLAAIHATEEELQELLEIQDALEVINSQIIPALDVVGKGFEKGTMFLPQLLMSAEAAKGAFGVIKEKLDASGQKQEKKGKIILATVKGDIHDIGKNIVKVLLENYSYDVLDLGKDVPPETIVETAVEKHIELVGLSALMTTTVPSMEETIVQLRKAAPWAKVMVGGAVLTQEYADTMGADQYCRDAMASVNYAEQVFGLTK